VKNIFQGSFKNLMAVPKELKEKMLSIKIG
jgi:hypothetical protein